MTLIPAARVACAAYDSPWPANASMLFEVGFERREVVFAGIDGAVRVGSGGAQGGGERGVLGRVGDVVLRASVYVRAQAHREIIGRSARSGLPGR